MGIDWAVFLACIAIIEGAGDPPQRGAAGEVGIYQISQAYLDDANVWMHRSYSLQQVEWSPKLGAVIVQAYIQRWRSSHQKNHPNLKFDVKVAARMHNGGPFGWNKKATKDYGERFMNLYNEKIKEHKR